jgi:hypothetical protein
MTILFLLKIFSIQSMYYTFFVISLNVIIDQLLLSLTLMNRVEFGMNELDT